MGRDEETVSLTNY